MSEKKSRTSPRLNKNTITLSVLLLVHSPTSSAEFTDIFLDMSLEELSQVSIVSLFNESTLEANSSATVIDESTWLKNGARRTNEVMTYQPSSVAYNFLGGSNVFSIRGYASRSSARGIATLLDGVPLNTYSFGTAQYFLSNFDLGALERVEMIRGPGSAIYGSDAFHGVYSLSTFESANDVLESEVGAGSTDYHRGYFRGSHSIDSENRVHMIVATTHKGDDRIEFNAPLTSNTGARKDAYVSETAVIKTEHEITNKLNVNTGLYFNRWNSEDFPSFGEMFLGADDISDASEDFYMMNLSAQYEFDNETNIEFRTFLWEAKQQFDYEFQLVPFQFQHDRRAGASIILKNQQQSGLRWMAGIGHDKTKIISAKTESGLQAFDGLERSINNMFAEVRLPFNNRKTFVDIAGRVDDYSELGSQFTPRLSVIQKLNYDEVVKLVYSNAFRAPVGSEITSSGLIQGNPDLKPETLDSYEVVWMKHMDSISYAATAFHNEWDDAIIIVDDSSLAEPFTQRYENQGHQSSRGYELELDVIYKHLRFETAYTFTQSKDKNKDLEFKAFPKHILQLSIDGVLSTGFGLRINNIVYHDTYDMPASGSAKLDTIWMTNLHIAYELDKRLEFSLDIRDIFNRQDNQPSLWGNAGGLPVSEPQISTYLRFSF